MRGSRAAWSFGVSRAPMSLLLCADSRTEECSQEELWAAQGELGSALLGLL